MTRQFNINVQSSSINNITKIKFTGCVILINYLICIFSRLNFFFFLQKELIGRIINSLRRFFEIFQNYKALKKKKTF